MERARMYRPLAAQRSPMLNGKKVLLVEDNEDNRTLFGVILRYYEFDVIEAADGESAVELARLHHPDVILMDIGLPGIDGLEATNRIKSDASTADIPIVALTAFHTAEDEARAVGCDSFLMKPCPPDRVITEVTRFLGAA
jgi:two-component system, cell cycle response regulator DivK